MYVAVTRARRRRRFHARAKPDAARPDALQHSVALPGRDPARDLMRMAVAAASTRHGCSTTAEWDAMPPRAAGGCRRAPAWRVGQSVKHAAQVRLRHHHRRRGTRTTTRVSK